MLQEQNSVLTFRLNTFKSMKRPFQVANNIVQFQEVNQPEQPVEVKDAENAAENDENYNVLFERTEIDEYLQRRDIPDETKRLLIEQLDEAD